MQGTSNIKEAVEEGIPFDKFLGVKVEHIEHGYAKLRLPFRPEFIGDPRRPALHGGVISMLIDTCGGTAVWASGDVEDRISTIDMRVDYLRPAGPEDLIAEARVKLLGNRVGNTSVIVYSASDPELIVAEGRAVYNVRKGK